MTTWYTADLHIGHKNIIGFCDRPYATVQEMNDGIVECWNEQVAIDDEVWIIGDACMGQLANSIVRVDELNGLLHLVPGNHDPVWSGCPKNRQEKWREEYEDRFRIERDYIRGDVFDLCHFPFVGHDHRDFDEFRPHDRGQWLVHGHVHDLYRQRGRQINVGLDAWGGRLVSEGEILAMIEGARDREAIPWS